MAKKDKQEIETNLETTQDDVIKSTQDFIKVDNQNVQIIEPIKLAQPIKQPERIEHSFYTEIKEVARKKEGSLPIAEQLKKALVNNINLGEIATSVLETIKYPAVVRAYFYALELSICYRLNSKDTLETALSTLRDAIFAAQYDKPLPKDTYVQSTRTLAAGTGYALQNSIDCSCGVIDAVIQAYDCSE